MDYDKTSISSSYDRARQYKSTTLSKWMNHIRSAVPDTQISHIVDLGCGTGRYSSALADLFEASVTGLDPSKNMLQKAISNRTDDSVTYEVAHAENLPLEDDSVDLVFMSNVYHHLQDPEVTVRECRRILRHPGYVVLRNSTSDQVDSFPYVGLFPGIEEIIGHYQPASRDVVSLFSSNKIDLVTHQVISHPMAENWNTLLEKAKLRADSLLVRLSDENYESGIEALKRQAATTRNQGPVNVNIDLFVFGV
jgi:ubiquinone/menaquinone biosynthesis C-methylase UbiE